MKGVHRDKVRFFRKNDRTRPAVRSGAEIPPKELAGYLTGRRARANDYGRGIFYIRGSDVLPPPLSPEEERRLTQRLAEQDSEARSTLIEHNLRLVVYIAKRFDSGNANVEDLISIGTIGLIKAVNTFDPSKNIKLATYAFPMHPRMRFSCICAVRERRDRKSHLMNL